MVVTLITLAFVGGGFVFYVRELRSAKTQSAPAMAEPLPASTVTVACTAHLAGFSADGGRGSSGRDRAVLSEDLLHLALRAGLRATLPRGSVTALRSQLLLGTLSVEVEHTGEGVLGPAGPMGLWGARREIEAFLTEASARGWPVRKT